MGKTKVHCQNIIKTKNLHSNKIFAKLTPVHCNEEVVRYPGMLFWVCFKYPLNQDFFLRVSVRQHPLPINSMLDSLYCITSVCGYEQDFRDTFQDGKQ